MNALREEQGQLTLEGEFNIDHAEELKASLLRLLAGEGSGERTVDLAAVTSVDVATIQLFYAASATCRKQGKTFRLLNPPEDFQNKVRLMQIDW